MVQTRQSPRSEKVDIEFDILIDSARANLEVITRTWRSACKYAKKRAEAGTCAQEECTRAVWGWMNSISRVEQDFVHSAADTLEHTLKLSLDLLYYPIREEAEEFSSAVVEGIRDILGASSPPFVSTQDET